MKKVLISIVILTIFGCAGTKTVTEVTETTEIISIHSEMEELCLKDYIITDFCGIGQGKSTDELTAQKLAEHEAKTQLAGSIASHNESMVKSFGVNDPEYASIQAAAWKSITEVDEDMNNTIIRKTRVTYNENDKIFTVYKLITQNRNYTDSLTTEKLKNNKYLTNIMEIKGLNNKVEEILNK